MTCWSRIYQSYHYHEGSRASCFVMRLDFKRRLTSFTIVTARNEVGARLCFHRRVWFCSQGGLPQCMLGYHPPPPGSRPPQSRTPGAGTPPSRHPSKQAPLQSKHPPSRHPPPEQAPPPPAQSMLGDTVNARAVRILLECNLVYLHFSKAWCYMKRISDKCVVETNSELCSCCTFQSVGLSVAWKFLPWSSHVDFPVAFAEF